MYCLSDNTNTNKCVNLKEVMNVKNVMETPTFVISFDILSCTFVTYTSTIKSNIKMILIQNETKTKQYNTSPSDQVISTDQCILNPVYPFFFPEFLRENQVFLVPCDIPIPLNFFFKQKPWSKRTSWR